MEFINDIGTLMTQPILDADTYKATHWTFEHPDFESSHGYLEARKGGQFDFVQWFGFQYLLRYYMMQQVTDDMKREAKDEIGTHVGPFNDYMWDRIIGEHDGYMPVRIKALPEGTIVRQGNVLATIESLDKKVAGVQAYIETKLMRVHYPTTIATRSLRWWGIINRYLEETGTPELAEWMMVDFGARGAHALESAAVGGMAHLVNFQVTDNLMGIRFAKHAYRTTSMPGYSIPATEHSVTTSWGKRWTHAPNRDGEFAFFAHALEVHGNKENPLGGRVPVSIVIDTYDQDEAVRMWLDKTREENLHDKLVASNMRVVLRPDSGDPVINVVHLLDLIGSLVGWTVNEKGYRVLPDYVRLIQGDGINEDTLRRILQRVAYHKWSADNLVFGSGGGLLVHEAERDTHRFAMKTSEVVIGGSVNAVSKEVATDPSKASKKGRFAVVMPKFSSELQTIAERDLDTGEHNYLQTVYETGKLVNEQTWEDVREMTRRHRRGWVK